MTTIFTHPDIFLHDHLAAHAAMRSNRIETIANAVLFTPGVDSVLAVPAQRELLELVHDAEYLDNLFDNAPSNDVERYALDQETVMNRYTLPALLLSVGAIKMAIDAVHAGGIPNAFCPVYAGHHAMPNRGMGFCFVNGVAAGAKYARQLGYRRIGVVDFDTHSGNGTLVMLKDDPNFLFAETYQPGFPGRFLSRYSSPQNILRSEILASGDPRQAWLRAWSEELLPALADYKPEIILISAGFDAHANDPLGMTKLQDEDYRWLTRALLAIQPHIVSVLEGGYSLPDTSRCARLHVETLAGITPQ